MENELLKVSSRACGLKADNLESVGSRRKLERTAGWADSVPQQSCLACCYFLML